MSQLPEVSVVIPAYNAAGTVAHAVESALGQTHRDLEVVVVDDGSTDDTRSVLGRFGDRIDVLEVEHGGLRRAREAGHRRARGDFIAWLDADDVAKPHRIEVQVAVMRHLEDVVVVSSDFTSFDETGPLPGDLREYYAAGPGNGRIERAYGAVASVATESGTWMVRSGSVRDELPFGNFVHPPTVMIRRSALPADGTGHGDLPISDDWLRLIGLAELGSFAFVDAPLIDYRRSAGQISAPAHRARSALDALRATRMVMDGRIDLVRSFPGRVRATMGARHAAVADALSEASRLSALRHLLWSLVYSGPSLYHARIAARTLAPRTLIERVRRSRGRPTS